MSQTITTAGGNLYALAAQYLNDATQWIRIAQANNLTDPFLTTAVQTIVIPPVDPSQTGGVPQQ